MLLKFNYLKEKNMLFVQFSVEQYL